MAEYIDKRRLLEYVKKLPTYYVDSCWQQEDPDGFLSPEDVIGSIENAPNADVAPVVHAHWKPTDVGKGKYPIERNVCTNCGFWEGEASDEYVEYYKFCPMCGAKIDNAKDEP